jgi:DNA-directed RNA polymerase specialized sigma24 family protein
VDGSVSRWIDPLREGDPEAARQLWDRFFNRLVDLARTKLAPGVRAATDEEDIALVAFDSFCRRAGRGEFDALSDREELWRLLAVITVRKAALSARQQTRQKRGGGVAVVPFPDDSAIHPANNDPSAETAVAMAEQCRRLFDLLPDPQLKLVARRRMEGHSVEEIAGELDCSTRTVKRKLELIRSYWEQELGA